MKTSARPSPSLFAANFAPFTVSPESIRKLPARYFQAVYDHLEDWNCHSENLVFLALRKGTPEQIETARQILRQHEENGFITSDLITQRNKLHTALQNSTPYPRTLTPLEVSTLISKLRHLENVSLAGLGDCHRAGNGPGSFEYDAENLNLFTIREALFILLK